VMAPLPPERITPQFPFLNVGIDFLGPFYTTVGRRTEKRYGMLVTDLVKRSCHLEMTHSMTSDSFILGFRRFCADRGKPGVAWTDNGTNLTAGEHEMREALDQWNVDKITKDMANDGITWHFNPPSAPWFGGVWESLVKSCKSAMRRVLGNRSVTDEILTTVFKEVAALLNGRPLTHLSVDPRDPEPLTPNHFLTGRAQPSLAPGHFDPKEVLSRRKWRAAQAIVDQIWRRWMAEYLPMLIERRKWLKGSLPLKEGDIVLIAEPNTPRGIWPLARIVSAHPGNDGVVRVVTLKTRTGTYVRPVGKLCLLEAHKARDNDSIAEE